MRIDNFECHLRYERHLAESTIKNYLHAVGRLNQFLKKDLEDSNRQDIRDFIQHLREEGISKSSVSNYIISIRSYFNWVADVNRNEHTMSMSFFLSKIIKIKQDHKMTIVPTPQEVEKLRRTLKAHKDCFSYNKCTKEYKKVVRDITIIELLISTGMRASELYNLRYQDINMETMTICIKKAKGDKQRMAIFSELCHEALKDYLDSNDFFPNERIFNISQTNVLNYIIKRWAEKSGINKKIHTHSFRHYHVTESLRQKAPIEAVANHVGHSNINTTMGYTHLNVEDLKEKFSCVKI